MIIIEIKFIIKSLTILVVIWFFYSFVVLFDLSRLFLSSDDTVLHKKDYNAFICIDTIYTIDNRDGDSWLWVNDSQGRKIRMISETPITDEQEVEMIDKCMYGRLDTIYEEGQDTPLYVFWVNKPFHLLPKN